jgi:protein SCO1/2
MAETFSRRRFLGASAAGAAGLALAACSVDKGSSPDPNNANSLGRFSGELLAPPIRKPDVTLTDQDGRPFNFRAATAGKLTLLYFGYTHCPDQCPVYLSTVAAARSSIGSGPGSRPQVIFVGVDVARDTPPVLKRYLGKVDRTFIGLTGSEALLNKMLDDVHFGPIDVGEKDSKGNYEVGHYNRVLAFTPDNVAHRMYGWDVQQQQLVKDLPRLAVGRYK